MQSSLAFRQWYSVSELNKLKYARWVWCLLAVIIVAVRHLMSDSAVPIGPKFGDTDDAVRLIQVRDFLINGNWYDTRLLSIGGGEVLNSHWSRLIDFPVAWLISIFALFTGYLRAEILAQIVWPLLLLFALARFFVFEVERRLGKAAGAQSLSQSLAQRPAQSAIIVLALLLLCPSGLFQFMPGRIDHHNVQIACAVVAALLLQRTIAGPSNSVQIGALAGVVMSVGLIVGLEALPLSAAILGLACLLACFDKTARPGAASASIALAVSLIIGFVATTHPGEWTTVECDELSPNLLGLTGAGALAAGLLVARLRNASPWIWLGGFAVAGVAGIGLYLGANPTCAGGAFAGMEPIVKTLWLNNVVEGRSLFQFAKIQPSGTLGYIAIMALALTILFRQALKSRATDDIFAAGATLLAALYGVYFIKFMPYGSLLALVPTACWIARLPAMGSASAEQMRMRAVIICNQTFVILLAGTAIGLFTDVEASAKAKMSSSVSSCTLKSDIAKLTKLPPGLVVSDIDLGPYIAVSTHHRAYAGPYHRIHKSISDLLVLFTSPVSEAAPKLASMNADYLVLCGTDKTESKEASKAGGVTTKTEGRTAAVGKSEPQKPASFSQYMRNGGTFKGLEPISIGKTEGPLRIWRIVKP